MEKKIKKLLYRILTAGVVFLFGLFIDIFYLKTFLFIQVYLLVSYDVIINAFKGIINGKIFDEKFLMLVATFAAISIHKYDEAVFIMIFYQFGRLFQNYALDKSRKSIADLANIRADYANVEKNGKIESVDPEEIKIDEIIVVRPSEKIPLDGVIVEGSSTINLSVLTGESIPKTVVAGDNVMSGCINLSGVLKIKVTKTFSESTATKILNLIENASSKKANMENFITRFARFYTPTIIILGFSIAILPSLFFGDFKTWIYRAAIFLTASCPCALVISIPLAFFSGLGLASKCGILVKGGNFLERMGYVKYFVFDKTGTITHGNFKVVSIKPTFLSKEELLKTVAYAENYSHHPIAKSIKEEYNEKINIGVIEDVEELQGLGVKSKVDGKVVYAGNSKLMNKINIKTELIETIGTIVYVAIDNKYAGYLVIADEIKNDAKETIQKLKENGINIIMLTGDKKEIAESVAKRVNIDEVYSELLPEDKVNRVEEILNKKSKNEKLAFVGDGINDVPVLALSDVSIAMGGIGTDAAIETADVVIMNDDLTKISLLTKISKKTIQVAKQNTAFPLFMKVVMLTSSALGYTSMWLAVFTDVVVSMITILNAVRILYSKDLNNK